jgi:REP element-mobilizing transposase RayT
MSRQLRVEFPGALYHVTARGNERKPIVRDDTDREGWLATLAQTVDRFGWRLQAWCLMGNHFHLVVETPRPTLARGMHSLNGVHATRFNRRHARVGHLFQGRYAALLIEREEHWLETCRYVVLNPARAKLPQSFERYRWSSCRATAGLEPSPRFLDAASLLAHFGEFLPQAQRRYRAFVREGLDDPGTLPVRADLYLAGTPFLRRRGGNASAPPEIPRAQRLPVLVSLEEFLRGEDDRAILRAYREGGYRLREIAEALGVHYSTVSRRLAAQERLPLSERVALQDATPRGPDGL